MLKAERRQQTRGPRAQAELEAKFERERRRARLFGIQRVPTAIAVSPLLWALPLVITGAGAVPTPDTGRRVVDGANVTVGLLLPVVTVLLWALTGQLITMFAVVLWLGWATLTASLQLKAADVIASAAKRES